MQSGALRLLLLTILSLLSIGGFVACSGEPSPAFAMPPAPAQRSFVHHATGLTFAVPADWTQTLEGADGAPDPNRQALVFAGPAHTDAEHTTLTLQLLPGPRPLMPLLDAIEDQLGDDREARLLNHRLMLVGGRPALWYLLRFEHYEAQRLKAGVFIDAGTAIIDLSYAAVRPLFASQLGVFEQALASLSVPPPPTRWPAFTPRLTPTPTSNRANPDSLEAHPHPAQAAAP